MEKEVNNKIESNNNGGLVAKNTLDQVKSGALTLEKISQSIEESVDEKQKKKNFRKAIAIEKELEKLETISGLSYDELVSAYESISIKKANIIVEKAMKDMPNNIKETFSQVDYNIDKIGKKIIAWVSQEFSSKRAVPIIASVMILVAGNTQANGVNMVDNQTSEMEYKNSEKQKSEVMKRENLQKIFKRKIEKLGTFRDLPAAIFFVYGRNNYNNVEQIIKKYGQPIVVGKNGEMGEVLEKYLNRLVVQSNITAKELDELIEYAKTKNSRSEL